MPIPWNAPIRGAGQISIFEAAGARAGSWSKVMKDALVEFNKLSVTHRLGVTFVQSATPPSETGSGGADVSFDTASGSTTFKALGRSVTLQVDGDDLVGNTQRVMTEINGVISISKAFIFVPATPKAFSAKGREVGDPVKLVMAVHELIHACGLANSDHSSNDVFFAVPSLSTDRDPNKDRITVGNTQLPPIILTADTVRKIRSVW